MLFFPDFRGPAGLLVPFYCAGEQIGLLRPHVKEFLVEKYCPEVFVWSPEERRLSLNPDLVSHDARSEALDKVLREMRAKESDKFVTLKGWREETYDVRGRNFQNVLFKMERAATCKCSEH